VRAVPRYHSLAFHIGVRGHIQDNRQSKSRAHHAELMLELFSAFNLVALAVISALFIWVLAMAVAGTAHEGAPFGNWNGYSAWKFLNMPVFSQ
jgi:hypothetical protein